jgi:hypothetical protein
MHRKRAWQSAMPFLLCTKFKTAQSGGLEDKSKPPPRKYS